MKKMSLLFYGCVVLFSVNAYLLAFEPQLFTPGFFFVVPVIAHLAAPGVIIIPVIPLFVKKYAASKRQTILFSVINLAVFMGFIFLWAVSLQSLWSV